MGQPAKPASSSRQRRENRTEAIKHFLDAYAPSENEDLLSQMMVTICRLEADGVDRGDLKILNTALKELRYAFKVFTPYGEIRKVSIFGSARTSEDHPQYLEAKSFAEMIRSEGWMVITGAGDGIMRAGNDGATREASFGVSIILPFEQSTNPIIADDSKLVNFKYFFTRKLIFVKEAHAIALFPGGFGTLDEGFESLTLIQTLKSSPTPVVLCDAPGGTYWRHWLDYVRKELLENGMIDPADMNLFKVTDRAQDAVDEIVRFYKIFHSSRYVESKFVMRLNATLSDACLDELNQTFGDIVTEGAMEQQSGPLEQENGEYPDKPRLVFSFDRRSAGRLRMLIDRINTRS